MSNGDYLNNGNNSKSNQPQTQEEQTPQEKNYLFFYIAIGCFAVGALLLGLAFAIKNAGTYMLFASMISELAAVTFLNAQKKKYNFKWIMVLRVASYAVMVAAIAIVLIGMSLAQK